MSDPTLWPDVQRLVHHADDIRPGVGGREEAYSRAAAVLSCWQYGHPARPTRRLKRFQNQAWRCNRCKAWFMTEQVRDEAAWGEAYSFVRNWVRVYEPEELSDGE